MPSGCPDTERTTTIFNLFKEANEEEYAASPGLIGDPRTIKPTTSISLAARGDTYTAEYDISDDHLGLVVGWYSTASPRMANPVDYAQYEKGQRASFEMFNYIYKVWVPAVKAELNLCDFEDSNKKKFERKVAGMADVTVSLDVTNVAQGAIPMGTLVRVAFADPLSLANPQIVKIVTPKAVDIKMLFKDPPGRPFKLGAASGAASTVGRSGYSAGATASSKIGGEPPRFDGTQKNGSIICPDRDPIPIPSRYNLDHSAPYGTKLNPMTPKCKFLPKSNENLVPYLGSTSTYGEAAAQIKVSWKEVSGESLTDAQASVLVGQWGSETGGGKSYFNWNPGGIKAYTRWTGKWVLMRTFEYANDEARACGSDCKTWVFSPFRAFDSQSESITSWIKLLTGSRHGVGKPFILAADHMGYARAIGNKEQGGSGYGTADAEKYGKLIKKLGAGWMAGTYI